MEFQDYYKTLSISRSATDDEIKKSYRKMARKYHPDVSKVANAEEKFKQAKEAYEVLKDPEKRKSYDQLGENWKQGQGYQPPPGWEQQTRGKQAPPHGYQSHDYSDFFESIFGQQSNRQTNGQDQHATIALSLEEAFKGTTRTLSFREPIVDPRTNQVTNKTRSIKVNIPAGVVEGQHIRLGGQGEPGRGGGISGDLYLAVEVLPHRFFITDGKDIHLSLPITPWEAALGANIAVPTLGGDIKLKIPPNSQTGSKLRLKGRGLSKSKPGDQYVVLKIHVPKPKTEDQRKLYEQMAAQMDFNPRKNLTARN